jgi:hypothetical protein
MNSSDRKPKKCPARHFAGEAFFYCCSRASVQQLPVPSMAFSVQFATEFTSAAAPRTVLQAASTSDPVIKAAVMIFWTIWITPPLMAGERGFVQSAPFRMRN